MTRAKRQIAIVGGTFDPVHWGHLKPILEVANAFNFECIHLLPTCAPPHRQQPEVLNTHRLGMLDAATELDSRFVVNDWELRQGLPSRTLPTLKHFHTVSADATLYFIIGMDSLLNLPDWQHWQRLFDFAHFIVIPRPGYALADASDDVKDLLAARQCDSADMQTGSGKISIADTQPLDISATELRQQLRNHNERPELLPEPVWNYIREHNLYR
ncbi:nicotinate-nucleotide adenylyltransferase [Aliidiomarina shirensis]|uniref:Probable nicotinate-nucleotide adenylyltransferase n=1 Tax=Aliidiomarina shirensis TaxID=1048642 RepID=A0A432WY84_9GAMM|nr:nicotinate-nucleotide adenylyltransferase [Aliidiomarina shirensis]RUO38719.1 nicotinate-nucleotide adenylyltransferase [Aliidiomarina shirensis]